MDLDLDVVNFLAISAPNQFRWLELLCSTKFCWILFKSAYFLLNSAVFSLVLLFSARIFSVLFGPEICEDLSFVSWSLGAS